MPQIIQKHIGTVKEHFAHTRKNGRANGRPKYAPEFLLQKHTKAQ